MDKATLWRSGHPEYQCGNTHIERCSAYNIETLQDAYRYVISQYSDHWDKYPDSAPPYIEHKTKGWKLFFFDTKSKAEEKTQSICFEYFSK